jgi:uncharacterized membrane protein YfcA
VNVEPEVLVAAALVIMVTSIVQGIVGFGANLLAAPVLAILDTDLIPGPIFVAAIVLTVGGTVREHDHIDRPVVGWASIGRLPGVVAGGVVLAAVSDTALQVLVGVTILVAVALSLARLDVAERRSTWVAAGAVSGFGATTAAIGGPPMALALQHRSGPEVRSTMSAFFTIGTLFTVPAIALAGRFGTAEMLAGLALAPGALVGFAASSGLRPLVDAGRLRPVVLVLSAVSGIALLLRVVA